MIANQGQSLTRRLLGQMIEAQRSVADVVEQRLQPRMEHREPVLHAGIALTGADRLIERVIGGRGTERGNVGGAKALLGLFAEGNLADRHQGELLDELARALRLGIERPDVLERVAEEVEPHRTRASRRIEIDNAAAHGIFAGLHDDAGALVARQIEARDQLAHVDALAGGDVLQRTSDKFARRNALQYGIDRGDEDVGAPHGTGHQPRQRRHPSGDDLAVRSDAVVGNRVPGGKRDHPDRWRIERQPFDKRL